MRITDIKADAVGVAFKQAYQHDRRFYPKPPVQLNTVVTIKTDDGLVGYGEAAHAPGVFGETENATQGAIDYFRPALIGLDPTDLTRIEMTVDRMSPIGNIAAKAAIDMAVHDLAGQALGVPVYKLLGGKVQDVLPSHITPATYEGAADDMDALHKQGYRFFKQKMSGDVSYDLPLVRELLSRIDSSVTVSLDANQGWTPLDALYMARMIADEPNYRRNVILEQPINAADVTGAAYLRQHSTLPIMADDGIRTVADLLRIIELGAADIVSLKISRVGGIRKCARMIAVAESYNIAYIVDEITEMRIANTAVAHLAVASKRPLYTGVTCHLLLEEDIIESGGVEVRDGNVWLSDRPGLGIEAIRLPQT